jgi:pimeloyl-ACP methyl ester carboxylesterase
MATDTKPVIVLAHGAWHSPLTYEPFISRLRSSGYEVHAPYFPSCTGQRPPTTSIKEDTQLIRRLLEMLTSQEKTIILVMHSYGGVVGCDALQGFDAITRKKEGKRGGVTHLVGLAAHIHPSGFSIFDLVSEMGNADLIPVAFDIAEDGSCFPKNAELGLFEAFSDAERTKLMLTLSRANIKIMEDKVQYEGWRDVPMTFVFTTKDLTCPAHYQQRMLDKIQAKGVVVDIIKLDTGHSPYLTMTEECVQIIDAVVANKIVP